MVNMKHLNSKKQILEDFSEHVETMRRMGHSLGQLQFMMNDWITQGAELDKSDNIDERCAAIMLSFAVLGVKATVLHEMGAKTCVAEPEESNAAHP